MKVESRSHLNARVGLTIKQKLGVASTFVVFSVFETVKWPDGPYDGWIVEHELDEVAFEGTYRVTQPGDEYWGTGLPFESEELVDPTWMDLCVQLERQIRTTGDTHHVFLEGAHVREDGTIELLTGS